jgi:hypothetical protein
MSLLKLAGKVDGRNGAVDYDLTGAVNIDLPLLRDLPFHQSGSFALGAPAN